MKNPRWSIFGAVVLLAGAVLAADSGKGQLSVMRAGSRPLIEGPASNFTGKAKIDRQVRPGDPARAMGSLVSFEPGARTAWHTHPLGQTLIVTTGCGWVQTEGATKEQILPGDVVWIPANTRHWHGAQPHSNLSHYAIVEPLNGSNVTWMEKVTDAQYDPQEQGTCKTATT